MALLSMSITPNVIRVITEGELALAVDRTLGVFAEYCRDPRPAPITTSPASATITTIIPPRPQATT